MAPARIQCRGTHEAREGVLKVMVVQTWSSGAPSRREQQERIARRDKKAFLSNQCKDIEENNKIGKTRDLIKKIGEIKGTIHARMGMIKDRNDKDLTEAEEIKKRWQEITEVYKTGLNDLDTMMVFSLT